MKHSNVWVLKRLIDWSWVLSWVLWMSRHETIKCVGLETFDWLRLSSLNVSSRNNQMCWSWNVWLI